MLSSQVVKKFRDEKQNLINEFNPICEKIFGKVPPLKVWQNLTGWVFEQTIINLFKNEFPNCKVSDQVSFSCHSLKYNKKRCMKIDININDKIYIELKVNGLYDPWQPKEYNQIRKEVENTGKNFLYVTIKEPSTKYKKEQIELMNMESLFYLNDSENEWNRLLSRIHKMLDEN